MSTAPTQRRTRSPARTYQDSPECPECGQTYRRAGNVSNEAVCSRCNTVLEQQVQRNRAAVYGPEDMSKLRTGGTVDLTETRNGLGTNQCPDDMWHFEYNPLENNKTKRLKQDLSDIDLYGSRLDLKSYEINTARKLYRRANSNGLFTGRSRDGFIGACLLFAVRESRRPVPLLLDEIRDQAPGSTNQFDIARGVLSRELNVKFPTLSADDLLARAKSSLEVPPVVCRLTKKLYDLCEGNQCDLPPTPQTRGGVLLTVAFELVDDIQSPNQTDIADAVGLNETTLSSKKCSFLKSTDILDDLPLQESS